MKICLNMIVKDEKSIILRSLESVCMLIDYWVIVDTGSSDGTEETIENFFKKRGIPGELHRRPWVDFSTNRNEALELAKPHGDYILFIDADEQLIRKEGFSLPVLQEDSYLLLCDNKSILFYRRLIVKATLEWKWVGLVHETLEGKPPFTTAILPGVVNFVSGGGGARSRNPLTRQQDIELLKKVVEEDPQNSHALFYLAMSYEQLDQNELAIQTFEQRLKIDDGSEEIYLSLLQIANIKDRLNKSHDIVFRAYSKAIESRPHRMEGYYYLARFLRRNNKLKMAYEIATKGMEAPETKDMIRVEAKIYQFEMALEYSVIALGVGEVEKGRKVAMALLEQPDIPEATRRFLNSMWNRLNMPI